MNIAVVKVMSKGALLQIGLRALIYFAAFVQLQLLCIIYWHGERICYSMALVGTGSMFFVLSGASMYVAYNRKFEQGYDIGKFIMLRVLRLAPLFGLVVSFTLINGLVKGDLWVTFSEMGYLIFYLHLVWVIQAVLLLLRGWSLGIEFVFYLLFPVMLAATRSRGWILLLGLAFVVQHVFIARTLEGATLLTAWASYIQPLSFIFYFMAGCCIGRLVESGVIRYSPMWTMGFGAALPLLFIHDDGNIVGSYGLLLSLSATSLTLCSTGLLVSGLVSYVSDLFGKLSYGMYLIHPLVFSFINKLLAKQSTAIVMAVTITLSALVALLLERYYETPIRNHTRRLLSL